MILGIANDLHAPAISKHLVALRDTLSRVIGAFRVNVRAEQANEFAHVERIEDGHGIHILESGQDFGALIGGDARTSFTLERAGAGIRIHAHHQLPAKLLRAAQIADVSYMQQIKTSIGKDDLFSGSAPLFYLLRQFILIEYLGNSGIHFHLYRKRFGNRDYCNGDKVLAIACVTTQLSITARSSSSRVTVAVPRFITTMPPA